VSGSIPCALPVPDPAGRFSYRARRILVSKFTDALGQEWRLEFDGFLLDRIEKEAGIDLADLSAGGLLAVERDAKALIRVLSVACEEQLKERRKPAAEFQKQIRKDAITRAREAVMEALADFFPQSECSEMQSSLTTRKNQPEMTPEQLTLAAGFLKMDPEVQRDVMSLIQQEMAADGSLPLLPEDESAPVPDAMRPTPADDSRESVESAPEASPSETSG
jgi:hypothetical protein